jgi:HK97 family phage major capsid protein
MDQLREQAAKLLHDARAIMNAADAEARTLTAEETQRYDAIMADYDAKKASIDRSTKLAQAETAVASHGPQAGRAALGGDQRAVSPSATPEYRDAFWRAMRSGAPEEFRALSVGTDTQGGYMVPDEFRRELIVALDQANVMRGLATVFTTQSGVMSLPVLSTHGDAGWTTEASAFTEATPNTSEITLNAYKGSMLIKVNDELLNDSAFDVSGLVAREFARGLGRLEEAAFVAGSGSGQPTGVVGGSSLGKTATATNAITADELMDTFYALGRAYRQNAVWLMHDTTIKAIRKLKTGVSSDNTYLWSPGLSSGEPDTLLGRPVYASQDMAEIATGNKVALFGDMSYYYVGDRQSIGLQRLVELYAASGQVGFRIFRRTDGKLALSEAVKHLKLA